MPKVQTLLLVFAGVSACSYSPPDAADLNRPSYHADLANKAAHHQAIAFGGYFLTYPISLPILRRREMRKCMRGKGYVAKSR